MKRFYDTVALSAEGAGYTVMLDGKTAKTPGRASLTLPTWPLAVAVASEWTAQDETVDPAAMPLTGLSNRGIDLDVDGAIVLRDEIAAYVETDLLRHRADGPRDADLARAQAKEWDPWLAWAAETLDLRLTPVTGLTPARDPAAAARASALAQSVHRFALPARRRITGILGSFVLAEAVVRRTLDPGAAFDLARLDERHQERLWGEDAEAKAREAARLAELEAGARFLFLSEEG